VTQKSTSSGSKKFLYQSNWFIIDTLGYNIFEENSIEETDLLYEDLIIEPWCLVWNAKSTFMDLGFFYSALTYSDY
jgi:hypothetical protein